MIFLTVGAQMPFDRLVRGVDAWAASRGHRDVIAQIGRTGLEPAHLTWTTLLDPIELRHRVFESEAVITHAGMGTILTALELGRPVIVLPRRARLRETRNDHQLATARALAQAGLITVARHEEELPDLLDRASELPTPRRIASHASMELLTTVRDFIHEPEEAMT